MAVEVYPVFNREVDWESYAGEIRVNYIRLVAIALFYGQHVLHALIASSSSFDPTYHLRATMLALTWSMLVIAVYAVSSRQQCPPYLKFLATAYDILMIALTIKLTEGYLGVWNMLYLLPITATALRHSLKLAYFATGLAIATYLCSLGFYLYWHVGAAKYWSDPQTTDLAVIVLSMLTTGLLAGQTIRQARRFGNIDRRGV